MIGRPMCYDKGSLMQWIRNKSDLCLGSAAVLLQPAIQIPAVASQIVASSTGGLRGHCAGDFCREVEHQTVQHLQAQYHLKCVWQKTYTGTGRN